MRKDYLKCLKVMVNLILTYSIVLLNSYATNIVLETGDVESPYLIYNETDLNRMSEEPTAHFKLMCDITLSKAWLGIENFSGILDGNGYNIYKYKNNEESSILGLVSINSGTIKNLGIFASENMNAEKCIYSGVFAGTNSGVIENCIFKGNICVSFYKNNTSASLLVGGISGMNIGTIRDCYVLGNISGENKTNGKVYCGGIIGLNEGHISDSFINGDIFSSSITSSGYAYGGGISGYNKGKIFNSGSRGSVYAHAYSNYSYSGGVIGFQDYGGECKNSYSSSTISATAYLGGTTYGGYCLGGLIGNNNGMVENCYAVGYISKYIYNNSYGGLVGSSDINSNSKILNSYFDKSLTGCSANGFGTAYTSAEMRNLDNYRQWDFMNIWGYTQGAYPILQKEKTFYDKFDVCNIIVDEEQIGIELSSNLKTVEEGLVIVGIYDEKDCLTKLLTRKINGFNIDDSFNFYIKINKEKDKKIKAYLWKDAMELTPIANVYTKRFK